jgi:hypothetical protein
LGPNKINGILNFEKISLKSINDDGEDEDTEEEEDEKEDDDEDEKEDEKYKFKHLKRKLELENIYYQNLDYKMNLLSKKLTLIEKLNIKDEKLFNEMSEEVIKLNINFENYIQKN